MIQPLVMSSNQDDDDDDDIIKNKINHSRPISIYYFYSFYTHLLFIFFFPNSTTGQQTTTNDIPPPPPPPPQQDYYYYKFKPSVYSPMAIMVGVVIAVFILLALFSIYHRRCFGDRRDPQVLGAGRIRRSSRRGLKPEVIENFPIFIYSDVKGLKLGKGALECAVCLNEFEDEDTLRLLPKCDHVFHPDCIDAWLVAHVTCPVCRANLKPESAADSTGEDVEDQNRHEDGRNETEIDNDNERNREQEEVTVVIADEVDDHPPHPEVMINPRPSRLTGKFPRSHSTGHSLVQPGENCERFTLRLPEDVRRMIVTGKLNRSTSCLALPTGDGSTRGGYRSGGEGSSRGGRSYYYRALRSERWVFSRTPPFFSRNSITVPLPSKVTEGDGGSTSGGGSKGLRNSVKAPFDCLGAKAEGSEELSVRSAV